MNQDSQNDSYEFISETIKKRPVNKRRIVLRTLFTIFLGALFGIVACFTYVLLLPRVEQFLYANDVNLIRLIEPSDVEEFEETAVAINEAASEVAEAPVEQEELKKEEVSETKEQEPEPSEPEAIEPAEVKIAEAEQTEAENIPDTPTRSKPEPSKDQPEPNEKPGENGDEPDEAMVTVTGESVQAGAVPEKQFEINDYTLLYQKIGSVADEVKKCMVTVTAVYSDSDWFQNIYESKDQTSGVILADNGKELLILARTSTIENADDIQVTFYGGERLDATLKKSDSNTGLSVVAVELSQIEEGTKQEYKMAELGNSKSRTVKGKPVIAIGDPLGVNDSIAIGQITSSSIVVDKTDSNVSLLTTDIYGSTNASGILCDFDGKVLGIICHDGNTQDIKNLIRAYSISDIKSTIEKILNGQDIAYLGIQGTDVTDEISDTYGIPKGAYVKQVVSDSPAMKAGIQNGDVIVKLGTNDIASFTDYKDAMLKCQPKDTTTVTIKRLGREEYVDISYEVVLGKL